MTDQNLIIHDPANVRTHLHSNFGIYVRRFNCLNLCSNHIQNYSNVCRRIDFFLSSNFRNEGRNYLNIYRNLFLYIHCPTSEDIAPIRNSFPQRARVRIFEERLTWVKIGYVVCRYKYRQLLQSNNSPQANQEFQAVLQILQEEVNDAKLGVQAQ